MSNLKHFYVITPEYEVYRQTEVEPAEWGCDVIEIEAVTKRDAIILGVCEMLKGGKRDDYTTFKWCRDARDDGCSPFAGVKAELVEL